LQPQVYNSPLASAAAVWCLAAATAATGRRARPPTGRGAITALSPLWMWNSGWPAVQRRRRPSQVQAGAAAGQPRRTPVLTRRITAAAYRRRMQRHRPLEAGRELAAQASWRALLRPHAAGPPCQGPTTVWELPPL